MSGAACRVVSDYRKVGKVRIRRYVVSDCRVSTYQKMVSDYLTLPYPQVCRRGGHADDEIFSSTTSKFLYASNEILRKSVVEELFPYLNYLGISKRCCINHKVVIDRTFFLFNFNIVVIISESLMSFVTNFVHEVISGVRVNPKSFFLGCVNLSFRHPHGHGGGVQPTSIPTLSIRRPPYNHPISKVYQTPDFRNLHMCPDPTSHKIGSHKAIHHPPSNFFCPELRRDLAVTSVCSLWLTDWMDMAYEKWDMG